MKKTKEILTPEDLSIRWGGCPAPGTLKNWRQQKKGPKYFKIGSSARYLLSDIKDYEKENIQG